MRKTISIQYSNIENTDKTINRKVQGVPQTKPQPTPTPKGREKWQKKNNKKHARTHKQTNAREAHRPALSYPSEVITMLKRMKKHEDIEHGNTLKHEAPVV